MGKIKFALVLLGISLLPVNSALALTTLNFEGLPDLYRRSLGNTNIGDYYAGVSFGPDATILDKADGESFYNFGTFPPHSGSAVFFSDSAPVDIVFANPVNYVEGWFTFAVNGTGGTLTAYDAAGNEIDNTFLALNGGTSSLMSVSGNGIKKVTISGALSSWTGDDIAFGDLADSVVPEPASLSLLGLGLSGLFFRKKMAIR